MFTMLFWAPSMVSADIPPPEGFHVPSLCAKITNLNEFPDVVLIAYVRRNVIVSPYVVKNNECLTKGYKFNILDVSWVTKEKFNLIDLSNLKLNDLNLLSENMEVLYFGGMIPDSNPLIKGTIEYSLKENSLSNTGNKYSLVKVKQISEYNDGTPIKIENFNESNLVSYNFGTATLRNGSRGEAVKELQRFLNQKLNLGLIIDGKLGPKTIAVIKQWQRDNGLVADGLVGAKTKAKMNSLVQ
jgi:hypothetical protein